MNKSNCVFDWLRTLLLLDDFPHFDQRQILELPDALASDAEFPGDLLQSFGFFVIQTKAQFDNDAFSFHSTI